MAGPRLSEDPDVAAVERWHLAFAPVWMTAVAGLMLSGAIAHMGDASLLAFGLAVALPTWRLPAWTRPRDPERARRYLLRRNLWLAVVVFAGTYVWTGYFFDLMGMRYSFPTQWHLEARAVGSKRHPVPLFLYPLTMAYFTTYYLLLDVAVRWLAPRGSTPWVRRLAVTAAGGYLLAMGETAAMNVPALAPYFGYADRTIMLLVGSVPYGLLFVVTHPLFPSRVADAPDTPTALTRAMAAGLAGMLVLDAWYQIAGPLEPAP